MLQVIGQCWALLLGMLLLMLGNGIQGTLLGIRGSIEQFPAFAMSFVMAGYFIGFLGGSRLAPQLIRRVGHVRVFAALGSLISAITILYATFPNLYFWFLLRVMIGFCFSGVYVVAESWLNEGSTNSTRGQALSVYMVVQMIGIVSAQALLNVGDPAEYILFVIASVLVSVSFAPILLSVSPAPPFELTDRMTLKALYRTSPLGVVGALCVGCLFSALWGMSAIYGTEAGFTLREISIFVAMIYVGGMICQFPIGWLSDRTDRRRLIAAAAGVGVLASVVGILTGHSFPLLLVVAFVIGGITNPLYSLVIAHTNDFLAPKDMASASGGLIFINSLGAVSGPVIVGSLIELFGPQGFFVYLTLVTGFLAVFATYRMTIRPIQSTSATASYSPVSFASTPVAVDLVSEEYAKVQEEQEGDTQSTDEATPPNNAEPE